MEPYWLMWDGPRDPEHTLRIDDLKYDQNKDDLGIWYLEIRSQRLKKMRCESVSPFCLSQVRFCCQTRKRNDMSGRQRKICAGWWTKRKEESPSVLLGC